MTSSRARHEDLLSGSTQRAFSHDWHRGPPLRLNTEGLLSGSAEWASSQAKQRAPPLRLSREGLLSGLAERASSQTWPLKRSGSAQGLLSGSTHRASSQAQHSGPPPGSSQSASSQILHGGLFSGSAEGLLEGPTQRASSQYRRRGPVLGLSREGLLNHLNHHDMTSWLLVLHGASWQHKVSSVCAGGLLSVSVQSRCSLKFPGWQCHPRFVSGVAVCHPCPYGGAATVSHWFLCVPYYTRLVIIIDSHIQDHYYTDIVSHVITNMDSGMVTTISSTDLSKAFDCVDRRALLAKLECYGVSPHWFADYFTDRRQTVRGGQAPSLDVAFGVVQGSIVGPLMFLLFTNDVQCYLSESCKLVSYADDTQLIHSASPGANGLADLRSRVELDLATISRWFHYNGLKINPSKTELIVLGTPAQTRKTTGLSIIFGDVQLLPSDCMKILGVHLDKNFNWQYHTGKIVQRCFGSLVTINKLKHVLPKTTIKTLIESLVFPHIRYCLPAWAPTSTLQRKRVDRVINFAVRVATGKRRHDHVTEPRKSLGWLSFEQTLYIRDCIRMYRVIHEMNGPRAIRALVKPRSEISLRSTRATEDGTIMQTSTSKHPRLEIVKKSLPYRAVTA